MHNNKKTVQQIFGQLNKTNIDTLFNMQTK